MRLHYFAADHSNSEEYHRQLFLFHQLFTSEKFLCWSRICPFNFTVLPMYLRRSLAVGLYIICRESQAICSFSTVDCRWIHFIPKNTTNNFISKKSHGQSKFHKTPYFSILKLWISYYSSPFPGIPYRVWTLIQSNLLQS